MMENILTLNKFSRPGRPLATIKALIMHWTGVPNQKAGDVRQFFEERKNGTTGYGSAHYIVDLDGSVLSIIPESEVAYHVGSHDLDPESGKIYTDWARSQFGLAVCDPATIGPNAVTLGIEMCVIDGKGNFTEQTRMASVDLAADICSRRGLNPFSDIGTHHGVVGWKDCPRLWVNHPGLFAEFKARVASAMARGRHEGIG